ncbi:MAG: amidohydrolase, partial [Proteobacteria bacterium]|nr:amidohydrolase [Pseudomonadota bacterium]
MKIVISLITMLASLTVFAEADKNSDETKKWDVNNPPGEAKLIDIKTDNGTWMNLDVSPDGKTIAFDMLGDIYILPVSGGKAKNITNSMAWEMQPRFSPNGNQLAVTSDEGGGDNIWTMDLQGENQYQVTKEQFRLLNAPAWSPDGQFIVARKHFTGMRSIGAGEIWMYHKSGGDGVQLNKRPNEQKDLGEPVFSADGKYVLFSRDSTPGKYFEYSKDSNNQIYEIYAIELATGKIKPWVSGQGGAVRPTPSPDGKSLAFVRRIRNDSSLFIQDRESGKLDVLYQGLERDMQETWAIHGVYPTFAWMPDGKDIVFWAQGKIHSINIASKKVTNIAFAVDDQREIRQAVSVKNQVASDQFDAKMLRWLSPSADGSMAVFQALGYIYTVKLPDGKPKRLTRQNDHFELYPKFTRDGKKIVYTTWDDEKLGSVRIAKLNGSSKKLTSKPGHYIDPTVSPDGKSLVYEAISAGYLTSPLYTQETGLYINEIKSGKTAQLDSSGSNPFLTDSSDRVFYTASKTDGEIISTQLKSVDLSGNNERSHYQGPWISSYQVSPDNQWLAFIQNFQVYVTPFIQNGQYITTGSKAVNLPLKKFSEFAGNNLNWNSTSSSLNWSLGSVLYSQKLDEKFAFLKPNESADQEENKAKEVNIQLLVKTDKPAGLIALTGAKIITIENINGQQQVIEDGVIIIKDNLIQAVGSSDQLSVPASAEVFDLKGKTIIPGMIDIHWHGPYANKQIIPQTS